MPARVLVVDDSALVRRALSEGLAKSPLITVVGAANNTKTAERMIGELNPNVMTLDMEMPGETGLAFLKRLRGALAIPAIVVSSVTERGSRNALDALAAGAVDVVAKPRSDMSRGLESMMKDLQAKVIAGSKARRPTAVEPRPVTRMVANRAPSKVAVHSEAVIAIGASTGGTVAMRDVLIPLPASSPGIVIVQHMPAGFTKAFADRMNEECQIEVREAEDGDRVRPGRALIAPGGKQMRVEQKGPALVVRVTEEARINGHSPSVEPLFDSVAELVGPSAVGVMMTGMGADGADAMVRLRQAGAACFAQDEASCVVFGMPKEALKRGGAERAVPLSELADTMLLAATKRAGRRR